MQINRDRCCKCNRPFKEGVVEAVSRTYEGDVCRRCDPIELECVDCGKKLIGLPGEAIDGDRFTVCDSCYEKNLREQELDNIEKALKEVDSDEESEA